MDIISTILTFMYNLLIQLNNATFVMFDMNVSFLSMVMAISIVTIFASVFWKGGKK